MNKYQIKHLTVEMKNMEYGDSSSISTNYATNFFKYTDTHINHIRQDKAILK